MEQTRNVFIPVWTADNLFMCFPNENLLLCDDECKLLSRDKIVASDRPGKLTSQFCSAAIQFNKL